MEYFRSVLGIDAMEKLKQTARDGVELGVDENLRTGARPRQIHLSESDTEIVWVKMWPDVKKGWAMLLTSLSKYAQTGLVAHPVFTVVKRNETGADCDKRVVTHCSVDGGYNTFCDMSTHPAPKQPKHTEIEKETVRARTLFPFSKVEACLKDVDAAFKRVRLCLKSIGLFGIALLPCLIVMMVLLFGGRPCPSLYDETIRLPQELATAARGPPTWWTPTDSWVAFEAEKAGVPLEGTEARAGLVEASSALSDTLWSLAEAAVDGGAQIDLEGARCNMLKDWTGVVGDDGENDTLWRLVPALSSWHCGGGSHSVKVWVDDAALVAADCGLRLDLAATAATEAIKAAGGPDAVNAVKDARQGMYLEEIWIWGLFFRFNEGKYGTVGLAGLRRERAKAKLNSPCFDWGEGPLPFKETLSLHGSIRHWAQCGRSYHPYFKDFSNCTSTTDENKLVVIPKGNAARQKWVRDRFNSSIDLFRLGIEDEESWRAGCASSFLGALSPRERMALPGESANTHLLGGDATPSITGVFDCTLKKWGVLPWSRENLEAIETALKEAGVVPAEMPDMIIAVQEMCGPLLGFATFAWDHQGSLFIALCDNQNVVSWCRKRYANNPYATLLCDMITRIERATGCELVVLYVRSANNPWPDLSTRLIEQCGPGVTGDDEFERRLLAHDPGYTRFYPEALFRHYCVLNWQNRSLAFPFEGPESLAARLGQRRAIGCGLSREVSDGPKPGIVEIACGTGQLSAAFQAAGCEVLIGVDSDYWARQTFAVRFPEALVLREARYVDWSKVSSETRKKARIITAGFPCTPWAKCGLQEGTDAELAWLGPQEIVRMIPFFPNVDVILLENSTEMLLLNDLAMYYVWEDAFASIGFDFGHFDLRGTDCLVAQTRDRTFLQGLRRVAGRQPVLMDPRLPPPRATAVREHALKEADLNYEEAFGGLEGARMDWTQKQPKPPKQSPWRLGAATVAGVSVPVLSLNRAGRTVRASRDEIVGNSGVLYFDTGLEKPRPRRLVVEELWGLQQIPMWVLDALKEAVDLPRWAMARLAGNAVAGGMASVATETALRTLRMHNATKAGLFDARGEQSRVHRRAIGLTQPLMKMGGLPRGSLPPEVDAEVAGRARRELAIGELEQGFAGLSVGGHVESSLEETEVLDLDRARVGHMIRSVHRWLGDGTNETKEVGARVISNLIRSVGGTQTSEVVTESLDNVSRPLFKEGVSADGRDLVKDYIETVPVFAGAARGKPHLSQAAIELLDNVSMPLPERTKLRGKFRKEGSPQLFTAAEKAAILGRGEGLLARAVTVGVLNQYGSHMRHWTDFSYRMGWSEWLVGLSNRVREERLIAWFSYETGNHAGKVKARTAIGKLYGVRYAHLINGLPDPLLDAPRLKLCQRAAKKESGASKPKLPATPELLWAVLDSLDLNNSEPDRVLNGGVQVGYFFMCRSGEYCETENGFSPYGLLVGDVLFYKEGVPLLSNFSEADEVMICIRGSKTDQMRQGAGRNHYATGERLCVVTALASLFSSWEVPGGLSRALDEPLFSYADGSILKRTTVSDALKAAAKRLGQKEADFASHSLRIGGCSGLLHENMPEEKIKKMGRWRSDCWRQYAYDTRESMRGVAVTMATTAYTLAHASLDFLAARKAVSKPGGGKRAKTGEHPTASSVQPASRGGAKQGGPKVQSTDEPRFDSLFPVGYRFTKRFGRQTFRGEIHDLDSDDEHEPIYRVRYEDGDEEDLHLSEMRKCNRLLVVEAPSKRSTRNSQRASSEL